MNIINRTTDSLFAPIEVGRAIVEGAHQPNGGLFLDTWHTGRGGIAHEEIAKIPGCLIGSVELDDADAEVKGTLWEDTIPHRRLPGEGVLDCRSFVKAILATGFRGAWSGEVISETLRKRPLKEAARAAFDATMPSSGTDRPDPASRRNPSNRRAVVSCRCT